MWPVLIPIIAFVLLYIALIVLYIHEWRAHAITLRRLDYKNNLIVRVNDALKKAYQQLEELQKSRENLKRANGMWKERDKVLVRIVQTLSEENTFLEQKYNTSPIEGVIFDEDLAVVQEPFPQERANDES
jgi:biopolymer transport protein ExbB/TolQ